MQKYSQIPVYVCVCVCVILLSVVFDETIHWGNLRTAHLAHVSFTNLSFQMVLMVTVMKELY